MKARRKGTNEPFMEIELVTFAGSTYDDDLYNVTVKDLEFEQQQEPTQDLRERAAIAVMQSIIPTRQGKYMLCDAHKKYDDCANEAIKYADALVKKLKGE